jgi:hypothetical protein
MFDYCVFRGAGFVPGDGSGWFHNRRGHMTARMTRILAVFMGGLLTACAGGSDGGGGNLPGIGAAGGVVVSQDGRARVTIPAGALAQPTVVTVEPATNQPSGNIGPSYEFGPDGTTFALPVTISILYANVALPSGTTALQLQLAKAVNNQWQALLGSSVDLAAETVSGTTSTFSTYGITAVSTPDPVPTAPTGVSAAAADGAVTVRWDPALGATSYNLYMATQSGVTKGNVPMLDGWATRSGVQSPFDWTGLLNGTTYYMVVTAVNVSGESAESAQVSAMPAAAAPPLPPVPPIVPPPSTAIPTVHTLTLTTEGTGTGVVTGAGVYSSGSVATVTAIPNTGSTFGGWSGPNGAECGTGSVSMVASKTCIATFTLDGYTLTLTTVGPGNVTGSGMYPYGSTAAVTATPNAGSTFAGWSGPNGAECATGSVSLVANKSCTATFTVSGYTLTLNTVGAGVVTGDGIYPSGTTAAVTATPNVGSIFFGWSGPDGAECGTGLVSIVANKSCTATFTAVSPLDNISTRAFVGTSDNVAITGFIVSGTGTKQVLIRGFGPTLSSFGVTGPLANPVLELYWDDDNNPGTAAVLLVNNDDWGTDLTSCPAPVVACGTATDISGTGKSPDSYAPTNPNRHLDAAVLVTLPPGTYTAQVRGASGGTGVALVAVNDINSTQTARLASISTRAFVGTADNEAIAGLILSGTAAKQVLIRGFGPTLSSFGVTGPLANPVLELYWDDDNNPTTAAVLLVSNDDWGTDVTACPAPVVACGMAADIAATGKSANSYAPSNVNRHLDAAVLVTLPPGTYTARLRGVSGGTGVGLVAVNEIGP